MARPKKHEFIWRYGGQDVFLVGQWDNWVANKTTMQYDSHYDLFRATLMLDPLADWQFKFVVDGEWRCSLDYPTVTDANGNVNNVVYAD